MKRTLLVLVACSVVLGLSSAVWAQSTTHFWFDIRDNTGAGNTKDKVIYLNQDITSGQPIVRPFVNGGGHDVIPNAGPFNGGGRGEGQVVYVAPQHTSGYHTSLFNYSIGVRPYPDFEGDADVSTQNLWLYLDVDAKVDANDVISSIGLDFEVTGATSLWTKDGPKNTIESITWTWEPLWEDTNAGKAMGLSGASGIVEWGDARAVKVPVAGSPPAFNTTNAITPNALTSPYRLGKLLIQGGYRECNLTSKNFSADSTWLLNMYVDDLLITRVNNTADPLDETCSFGYAGGVYNTTTVDGSTAGDGGWAQVYIQVRQKWDGDGKGTPGNEDLSAFIDARDNYGTALTQWQCYIYDHSGDRLITNGDLAGLIAGKDERDNGNCP
jgi:hypothetical protein